jgi:hypothetical protein
MASPSSKANVIRQFLETDDRVPTGQAASKGVKAEAGNIESFRRLGGVQGEKDAPHFGRPIRLQSRGVCLGPVPLQVAISERLDHGI